MPGVIVNQSELADLYGVHRNTVANWIKRGLPVEQAPNGKKGRAYKFNTAQVAQWKEEQAVNDATGDTEKASAEELMRRKLAAETTQAEIKAAEMRREVVFIDDVVRMMTDDVIKTKARLRTIPQRTSSRIVGQTDESIIKQILLSEIDLALNELANRFIEVENDPGEDLEQGEDHGIQPAAAVTAV